MRVFFRKSNIASLSPGRIAWRRFSRIPTAVAGLFWILGAAALSVFAYVIIPDRTPFANHQHLELALHPPGTGMHMLRITRNHEYSPPGWVARVFRGAPLPYQSIPVQRWWFEDTRLHYETYPGQPGYPGMELYAGIEHVLFPVDYSIEPYRTDGDTLVFADIHGTLHRQCIKEMQQQILDHHLVHRRFLLGTDRFGRDMLSRLVVGTRVSLSVGFIAVLISLLIGITLGSLAGYFRGRVDSFIVWLINVVWSIPTLLLAIAITFALGKGFWQVFVAVGLTMWVEVARLVRGQVISIRENTYIESARALGLSSFRIIMRHILPGTMGPVIVISAANFASAILIEAGLSFLGIGVQPPMPSWGSMIREHYGYIILDKGYLAVLPGLAIMLMVMAFMMTGNGLREALDRSAKD
ncbi:MAG: ABC transporter permease [Bacteroidales bacterium]|nr:ABC transporter permease [Bacteroidales bacterium]